MCLHMFQNIHETQNKNCKRVKKKKKNIYPLSFTGHECARIDVIWIQIKPSVQVYDTSTAAAWGGGVHHIYFIATGY